MTCEDEASIFLKTPAEKALNCATQFGTNARITKAYQRLAEIVGDKLTLENLEAALTQVEKEFGIEP